MFNIKKIKGQWHDKWRHDLTQVIDPTRENERRREQQKTNKNKTKWRRKWLTKPNEEGKKPKPSKMKPIEGIEWFHATD